MCTAEECLFTLMIISQLNCLVILCNLLTPISYEGISKIDSTFVFCRGFILHIKEWSPVTFVHYCGFNFRLTNGSLRVELFKAPSKIQGRISQWSKTLFISCLAEGYRINLPPCCSSHGFYCSACFSVLYFSSKFQFFLCIFSFNSLFQFSLAFLFT